MAFEILFEPSALVQDAVMKLAHDMNVTGGRSCRLGFDSLGGNFGFSSRFSFGSPSDPLCQSSWVSVHIRSGDGDFPLVFPKSLRFDVWYAFWEVLKHKVSVYVDRMFFPTDNATKRFDAFAQCTEKFQQELNIPAVLFASESVIEQIPQFQALIDRKLLFDASSAFPPVHVDHFSVASSSESLIEAMTFAHWFLISNSAAACATAQSGFSGYAVDLGQIPLANVQSISLCWTHFAFGGSSKYRC